MKRENSIGYNYVMNTIIQGSAYILPLVANPYVSRVLGPEGMGQVSYATAIIYYFTMFAVLGVPTYGIREVAKAKTDKNSLSGIVYGIAVINLVMGVIVYFFYFVYIKYVPLSFSNRKLLLVMSPTILLNLIGFDWLYKGMEKFSAIAIRNVIIKMGVLVLTFAYVHSMKDIYLYGFLTVIATYGVGIWNFFGHFRYVNIRNMKGFAIKKHILPILIFFSMTIATTIYTNIDMVMLGIMRSDYDVGIYDASTKLKTVAIAAVSSLGAVLLPRVTSLIAQGKIAEFKNISEKALNLIAIFSLSLMAYVWINSATLISIFSGEKFAESVPVLKILTPTFFLIGMTNIIGIQMLLPMGKEKMVLASEIAGAVMDLIINILLIPHYGAIGAAVGTLVAEVVVLIVQAYACRKYVVDILTNIQFKKIFVAGVFASFFAWFGSRMIGFSWGKIICSLLTFYLMYGCILVIVKEKTCLWIMNQVKRSFLHNINIGNSKKGG